MAQGEYLSFLDADIELSKNWLKVMHEQLNANSQRKLISAYQICSNNPPELEKVRTELSNIEIDVDVAFLPGRNLFLHRDTFHEVAGFPEHLITCEDYFFTDQVSKLGSLFYTSQASYVHLGEDVEWGQLFHKEIWRGQSNLKSLKGRKIPLREYPSLLVPFWIFIFSAITIISFVTSQFSLSMFSIIAVLLPIGLYSYRLHRLTKEKLKFIEILKFYFIYFAGRAIGTVAGILKSFNVRNAT